MGTDIHIVAQFLNADGKWEDCDPVPRHLEPRNYTLFAMLDGTRDYLIENPPAPICTEGPPEDFDVGEEDCQHNGKWMGYGACGHATLAEILAYDLGQIITPATLPHHARGGPAPLRDSVGGWVEALRRFFIPLVPEACRIVWGYDS
jgi:hypothetical protein